MFPICPKWHTVLRLNKSFAPARGSRLQCSRRRPSMAIAMSLTIRRPKRRPAFVCSVGMAAGASGWRQCAWTVIWYTILTLPRVDVTTLAAAEIMLICSNSDRSAVSGQWRSQECELGGASPPLPPSSPPLPVAPPLPLLMGVRGYNPRKLFWN